MKLKLLFLLFLVFTWLCGAATMYALYPKYFEMPAPSCPAPLTYQWEERSPLDTKPLTEVL